MRHYTRHPTDLPIEVWIAETDSRLAGCLQDVSDGGLSFQGKRSFEVGRAVTLRIPLGQRAFQAGARVVQCRRRGDSFHVGVAFTDPNSVFQARMVAQICHIERYKREAYERDGRVLSGQQAAREWIERCAEDFARSRR